MIDQYIPSVPNPTYNINFHAYTCVIIYYLFLIATCVKGKSRFLWVGRLGFYKVAVGFYKLTAGLYKKIRHSQNYDNYTLN